MTPADASHPTSNKLDAVNKDLETADDGENQCDDGGDSACGGGGVAAAADVGVRGGIVVGGGGRRTLHSTSGKGNRAHAGHSAIVSNGSSSKSIDSESVGSGKGDVVL